MSRVCHVVDPHIKARLLCGLRRRVQKGNIVTYRYAVTVRGSKKANCDACLFNAMGILLDENDV